MSIRLLVLSVIASSAVACVSKGDTNVSANGGGAGSGAQGQGGGSSGGVGGVSTGGAGGAACPDAGDRCSEEGLECGNDSCGNPCGTCDADGGMECGPLGNCIESPALVGCADGTREGFVDRAAFPAIAACRATWTSQSMRASRTGAACGNDLGPCNTPEDSCSDGWHLCLRNGWPKDLSARTSYDDCLSPVAGEGAFFAGSSTFSNGSFPSCAAPLTCSSATHGYTICCGTACSDACGSCKSCVWPSMDARFSSQNCVTQEGAGQNGTLCCRDPAETGS
jgi:hypothetical protein